MTNRHSIQPSFNPYKIISSSYTYCLCKRSGRRPAVLVSYVCDERSRSASSTRLSAAASCERRRGSSQSALMMIVSREACRLCHLEISIPRRSDEGALSSGFWSRSRKLFSKSFIFEYVRFLHSVIINFSNFLKKLPRPACIDGRACMASPLTLKLFSSITRHLFPNFNYGEQ